MLRSSDQGHDGGNLGVFSGRRMRSVAGSTSLNQNGSTAPTNGKFEPQNRPTGDPDLIAIGTHASDAASQGLGHTPSHHTGVSLAPLPNAVVAPLNVNRSFQCELCRAEFTARDSLLRHERTLHNSDTCPKYYCPEPNCERHSRPFLRHDSLMRHQRKFLHLDNSPPPWTVYSQRHELSAGSYNNQVRDLDWLMQLGQIHVQLYQRPLSHQREYVHGVQQESRRRRSDILSQMQRLRLELQRWKQTDQLATERLIEIAEIEELEYRRNFVSNRIGLC